MITLVGMVFAVIIILLQIQLLQNVGNIMATVQELKDALASIADGVNALEQGIKDLKAQVAAGGVVSQADLDELAAKAAEIVSDIADTSDQG
jgi:cell division protein FtsB